MTDWGKIYGRTRWGAEELLFWVGLALFIMEKIDKKRAKGAKRAAASGDTPNTADATTA